jgi:hypothetical protein
MPRQSRPNPARRQAPITSETLARLAGWPARTSRIAAAELAKKAVVPDHLRERAIWARGRPVSA